MLPKDLFNYKKLQDNFLTRLDPPPILYNFKKMHFGASWVKHLENLPCNILLSYNHPDPQFKKTLPQAKRHRRNVTGETSQAKCHRQNVTGEMSQVKRHRQNVTGEMSQAKRHRRNVTGETSQAITPFHFL